MTALVLAWRMRTALDGTRIPFTRALRFARLGLAGVAELDGQP